MMRLLKSVMAVLNRFVSPFLIIMKTESLFCNGNVDDLEFGLDTFEYDDLLLDSTRFENMMEFQEKCIFVTENPEIIRLRRMILKTVMAKYKDGQQMWGNKWSRKEYNEKFKMYGLKIVDLIAMACIQEKEVTGSGNIFDIFETEFCSDGNEGKVVGLNISGTKITNFHIGGFEFFSNLECLYMNNCGLSDSFYIEQLINVLPNLKVISIEENEFTRIPDMSGFKKLCCLYLRGNPNLAIPNVDELDFPQTLEVVRLNDTNITIKQLDVLLRKYGDRIKFEV